ncbi:MAG: MCE family protein [Deltaproteobacteria bacterium]|nr:MCE family protein [Deltaproteobacteria bacterium]
MAGQRLETKVGLFTLAVLVLIAVATLKVGEQTTFLGGGYEVTVTLDTAIGITKKTPVEIAGIQIGVVKSVELVDSRRAHVVLQIDRGVRLPPGTSAMVRAKGFLGDTYIELVPGPPGGTPIAPGSELAYGGVGGDINLLITQFTDIAHDIKAVTSSLRELVGTDEGSPVYRSVMNLDRFAEELKTLIVRNESNVNRITDNLAEFTENLRGVAARGRENVEESLSRIASITRKVDEGQGTIGKLINDPTTAEKVNQAADSLSETLGGFRRLEAEIGYHTEYLTATKDFKHYVHLNLQPRPDESFRFEFVEDRSPSPNRSTRTTTVTTGGASTTVVADTQTIERNKFRVSAQIAKQLYDFTMRGGLIESRGGVGLDFARGPIGAQFSAFDFNTQQGNKPHLKLTGNLNLTKSLYLLGGADDMLNPAQKTDWFIGAGVRIVDDDVKSLLSGGGLGSALKQ